MRARGTTGVVAAGLLTVGAGLAVTSTANAALTLTLSEPGQATQTVVDTGNTGTVAFVGSYGNFVTNIVYGVSNKLTTPTPSIASLQVQSLDIKAVTGTPNTLTVTVTDDGFTFPATTPVDQLSGSLAGTLTGTTTGDNVQFFSSVTPTGGSAQSTASSTFTVGAGSAAPQSFSMATNSVNFARPTSYTLSSTTTATLTGAGTTANLSGSTTVTPVPEPAALGLAAAGLGLAGFRRRRQAR